jgi:hypothetical protein
MRNDENVMKAITNVRGNESRELLNRTASESQKCVELSVMECLETPVPAQFLINWSSSSLLSQRAAKGIPSSLDAYSLHRRRIAAEFAGLK